MRTPSLPPLSTPRPDAIPPAAASIPVFLRLPQVLARIPISRSTLWRRVQAGSFPRPLKLSARVTVWRSQDIEVWMREQD